MTYTATTILSVKRHLVSTVSLIVRYKISKIQLRQKALSSPRITAIPLVDLLHLLLLPPSVLIWNVVGKLLNLKLTAFWSKLVLHQSENIFSISMSNSDFFFFFNMFSWFCSFLIVTVFSSGSQIWILVKHGLSLSGMQQLWFGFDAAFRKCGSRFDCFSSIEGQILWLKLLIFEKN